MKILKIVKLSIAVWLVLSLINYLYTLFQIDKTSVVTTMMGLEIKSHITAEAIHTQFSPTPQMIFTFGIVLILVGGLYTLISKRREEIWFCLKMKVLYNHWIDTLWLHSMSRKKIVSVLKIKSQDFVSSDSFFIIYFNYYKSLYSISRVHRGCIILTYPGWVMPTLYSGYEVWDIKLVLQRLYLSS